MTRLWSWILGLEFGTLKHVKFDRMSTTLHKCLPNYHLDTLGLNSLTFSCQRSCRRGCRTSYIDFSSLLWVLMDLILTIHIDIHELLREFVVLYHQNTVQHIILKCHKILIKVDYGFFFNNLNTTWKHECLISMCTLGCSFSK